MKNRRFSKSLRFRKSLLSHLDMKPNKFIHYVSATPSGSDVYRTMIFYKHGTPKESNKNVQIYSVWSIEMKIFENK